MAWQRTVQTLKTLLKISVILAVAGFIYYQQRLAPVPVKAVKVERGTVVDQVMGTGTLEAHTKVTISPKIQGRLVNMTVDQNDRVTTGQLLASLDDSDLKEQVAMAQAALETAQASLGRVKADENRTKVVSEQAKVDFERSSKLRTGGIVSVSDLDKNRENLQVSEAQEAQAAAAIIETSKQITASEKSLRYQEARLADTKVFSPLAGLITRRDRQEGDIVVPGSSIFQLVSTDDLWISAWVDETSMAELQVGLSARIVFRSEPQKGYLGAVVRLGREVDRETREFLVDVRVHELPGTWAMGQRAEVYIEKERKENVIRLPAGMVIRKEQKPGVYVSLDGKAAWRELTLGVQGEKDIEIVGGLSEQDIVIMASPADAAKLTPGRRVRLIP